MSPLNPCDINNRRETDGANRIRVRSLHTLVGEPHSFAENPHRLYDIRNRSETDGANRTQLRGWHIPVGEPYSVVENPHRMCFGSSVPHFSDPDQPEYVSTSLLSPQPQDSVVSDLSETFIQLANQSGASQNGVQENPWEIIMDCFPYSSDPIQPEYILTDLLSLQPNLSEDFTHLDDQPGTSQNCEHDYSLETIEDCPVSPSTTCQMENENSYENEACQLPRSRRVPIPEENTSEESEAEEESSVGVASSGRKGSSSEDRFNSRESNKDFKKVRLPEEHRKDNECAYFEKGCSYMSRRMIGVFDKFLTFLIMEERKHEMCRKLGSSLPSQHMSSGLNKAYKKGKNKIHHTNQRSTRKRGNTPDLMRQVENLYNEVEDEYEASCEESD